MEVRMARPRGLLLATLVTLGLSAAACLPAGTRGSGGLGPFAAATPPPGVAATPAGPTPTPSFVAPTPTPAPSFLVYTVAKGDSLNTIADRFGTTARSIAYWNRASYPSLDPESTTYKPGFIQVGWALALIPDVTVDEQELPDPSSGDAEAVESETMPGP
jgi:hypothetical protein